MRVCVSSSSFNEAIQFGRQGSFDGFLAVGGGSVMDTAKVANLFACYPENELMDFVAAPFGKGTPILKPLHPLICGEPGCVYTCSPWKRGQLEGGGVGGGGYMLR